ncbi:MAG: phage holin family protein [Lachnospiraceae bacterium]|nr:phage holin family protein [Lachnospiraceae bacterium]
MANYIIQLFGGFDKFLSALIVFIVINHITEILLVLAGEVNLSNVFLLKNIFKKAAIFILVIISNIIGTIIESNCAIRTTVILFYISNEGFAILKNINQLGVPLPQILADMLNRIGDRK